MRRGSKPRGDWILTLNVPGCLPKPSTHHMLDCVLYGRAAGKCSIICSTHSLKPAAERCASELITCPTLQASIQCVKHLSKCKRTWPIFLLLLSPLLFINCSLFNTEPVFIQNVQRHITLAFAGLVRLIPELVFREVPLKIDFPF